MGGAKTSARRARGKFLKAGLSRGVRVGSPVSHEVPTMGLRQFFMDADPTARLKSGAEKSWQMAADTARRDFRPTGRWAVRPLINLVADVIPSRSLLFTTYYLSFRL
jgi:hypothetical protein